MRVSMSWLAELVELPKGTTPAQVAERLTAVGLEVEGIEDLAAPLQGVVVARVAAVEGHPQADKLRVCTVEAGGAPLTVVCGAANVEAGARVLLAKVGTVLPGGKKIEAATIRGVASEGMLCSAAELGLPFSTDGLLLLDDKQAPGTPAAAALHREDSVFTLGVTPNRPDALAHIGVARELAAAMRVRLRAAPPTCPERAGPVDDLAQVTIEDPEGCPRYACRVIEGVVVGPSPSWLVMRLAACGVRTVNNVVDVTNLVMMERGIPLHAFDYDRIGRDKNRATIVVRSARAGEQLATLDGKTRTLLDTDLVIADAERAIALAGVMGGADTEVGAGTTRVLLECAHFAPARVRKTARRLALHSEASHRFERGADPNGVTASLDRAAALIAELSFDIAKGPERPGTGVHNISGGRVARGIVDVYPKKIAPAVVTLRPKRAAQLLGLPQKAVDEATISKLLLSIGLEVDGRDAEALRLRVPTYRPDLTREVDLIEELLRLLGTDSVPATLPARASEAEGLYDPRRHRVVQAVRTALEATGFDEAVNLAFVSPAALDPFDGGDVAGRITLRNPLGEEMSVLRKSLLPGLLANAATNHRRQVLDVRLFEVASVFLGRNPSGKSPVREKEGAAGGDAWAREVPRIAGIATGGSGGLGFDVKHTPVDFYDARGAVEQILDALGVPCSGASSPVSFIAADDRYPFLHPRARAEVWVARRNHDSVASRSFVGVVGELHPDLVASYQLKTRVVGFELDVETLARVAGERPRVKALPRFPSVRRDFALVLGDQVSAADLCARMQDNGAVRGILEGLEVFDVYRGPGIPPGKRSLALALTLRAADRTLTDEEITRATEVLLQDARAHFGAEVRS